MMLSGTEARVRYLTVAVFSQKVLDALVASADHGNDTPLKAVLEQAVQELKAAIGNPPADYQEGSARAFSSYEQVRTLDEIGNREQIEDIIRALERLDERLKAGARPDREQLEQAIDFFSHLESRALRNFDQPTETMPRGIHELCKAS